MTHCHVCHIAIALYDPERVQKGIFVYHRKCLRKEEAKEEAIQRTRQPKPPYYRLHYGTTVH